MENWIALAGGHGLWLMLLYYAVWSVALLVLARSIVYHAERLVWQVKLAIRRHQSGIPPPDVEPHLAPRPKIPFR